MTMEDADLLHRTSYTVHYESDDDEGDASSDDEFFLGRGPWDPTIEPDSEPYSPVNSVTWGSQYFRGAHLPPRDTGTLTSPPSASPLWENLDEQINQSRPPPAQLLEPNAIFNHKVRKSKCVINFEPAMYVNTPTIRYMLTCGQLRKVHPCQIFCHARSEEHRYRFVLRHHPGAR